MRRINRFFLLFGICLLFGIMNGCGFISWSYNPDDPEEELGVAEVLNNAQNRINSLTGYHILTKGQTNQRSQGNQGRNYNFELDQKFNNQPQALHSVRKRFENGSVAVQEMYIVDGFTYINTGAKWTPSANKQERFVLSQNPPDFLRFASEANGQGVTLEKESNAYVVKVDKTGGEPFLQQLYAEARNGLQQQGIYVTLNDFQTTSFQQKIWIDKQTFDLQKMETELVYMLQYNGSSVVNESRLQVNYQGEYNNRIRLPENVKTN